MNDELKKALTDYSTHLLALLEKGTNFTLTQIPIVIQEKLRWDFAFNGLWLMIGLVFVGTAVWAFRQMLKQKVTEDRTQCQDDWPIWLLLIIPCGIIGSIVGLMSIFDMVKIWVAPRLYIIEWLREGFK